MFNRKKSPHNAEELMIAEYMRLQDDLEHIREELKDEQAYSASLEKQLRDNEDAFKATNAKRDERLREVEEQSTGIIDLHTTQKICKVSLWTAYRYKDWAKNHTKDKAEQVAELRKLLSLSDYVLGNRLAEMSVSYYGCAIDIDEVTVRYVLSMPWQDGRKTILYCPQRSEKEFILPLKAPQDDRWTTASRTECMTWAVKEARSRITDAIDSLAGESDD